MSKILIIEEDAGLRSLLRIHLSNAGHKIIISPYSADVLEKCLLKPEIILIDLIYPDKSNSDILLDIKNNPLKYGTPIIIGISAAPGNELVSAVLLNKGLISHIFRNNDDFEQLNDVIKQLSDTSASVIRQKPIS